MKYVSDKRYRIVVSKFNSSDEDWRIAVKKDEIDYLRDSNYVVLYPVVRSAPDLITNYCLGRRLG